MDSFDTNDPLIEKIYQDNVLDIGTKNLAGTAAMRKATGSDTITYDEAGPDQTLGQSIGESLMKAATWVGDAFDYANNISRVSLMAYSQGRDWDEISGAAMDAATGKSYVSAGDLREHMHRTMPTLMTAKHGKDDGKFQMGDVADIALDMGIDIVTDPLTFIGGFAAKAVAKGTQKLASKLMQEGSEQYMKEAAKRVSAANVRAQAERLGTMPAGFHGPLKQLPDDMVSFSNIDEAIMADDAIGAFGKIEREKLALESYMKAQVAGGQGIKEAYQAGLGGVVSASSGINEDSTPQSVMQDFAMGAAGFTVAKKAYNKVKKKYAAQIGEKINRWVSPKKKVVAKAYDQNTGKYIDIESDVPRHLAMETAVDAGKKSAVATAMIQKPLLLAVRAMRKSDAVGAAIALQAASRFRDYTVLLRGNIWQNKIAAMSEAKLNQLGLHRGTLYKDAPNSAKELLDEVNAEAKAFISTPDGKLDPQFVKDWADVNNIEMTDRVLNNFMTWKKAADESWEIEKKLAAENLFDEKYVKEVLPYRQEEAKRILKSSGYYLPESSMTDLKGALDLKYKNQGFSVWTPRITERGMAITREGTKEAKPKVFTKQMKRAGMTEELTSRKMLGKTSDEPLAKMSKADANTFMDEFEGAIGIAAKNKAQGILNQFQKESMQYLGLTIAERSPALDFILKFNQAVKKGLLLGSFTWLKNNYWSNIRQAFIKGGLMDALGTGAIGAFHRDLNKDLAQLFFHRGKTAPVFDYRSKYTDDLVADGIIDAPTFQDTDKLMEDFGEFMMTPQSLEKMKARMDDNAVINRINSVLDFWSEKVLHTRQIGSYIEAFARAKTYIRTREMLEKEIMPTVASTFGKEAAEKVVREQATKITNDVFFDYGKLKYWERTYARELIPFYSFYKQNLFYQTQALLDPTKGGRINLMQKVGEGTYFGQERMSERQRASVPRWLKSQNAVVWTDPQTFEKKIFYSTSDPASQAYQMLQGEYWFKGDFMQQINPALKTILEQGFNYDFFRGQSLNPEDVARDPRRKIKQLYSRGYIMGEFYNALLQSDAVWKDANGNPVTDREAVARIDNVMSWGAAMFTGVPVQVGAQIEKIRHGKQDYVDALTNLLGPVSTSRVIPEVEKRRLEEYEEERRAKAYEQTDRALRRAYQYRNPYAD